MPLSEPWSPVGYQVVQLPDVNGAGGVTCAAGPRPQPQLAPAESPAAQPRRPALPKSPIGYRVTLVREDCVPVAPTKRREGQPSSKHASDRPRPRSNGMAIWLPLVVVAAVGVPVFLATAIASAQRGRQPRAVHVINGDQVVLAPVAAGGAGGIGVDAAPGDACIPCAQVEAAPLPPDREYHGTALHFARNPVEAARIARDERKLTFVLHVSGNFDDPGFT
jgi:hypothetical protein